MVGCRRQGGRQWERCWRGLTQQTGQDKYSPSSLLFTVLEISLIISVSLVWSETLTLLFRLPGHQQHYLKTCSSCTPLVISFSTKTEFKALKMVVNRKLNAMSKTVGDKFWQNSLDIAGVCFLHVPRKLHQTWLLKPNHRISGNSAPLAF